MKGLHAIVVLFHPDMNKLDELLCVLSDDVDRVWLIDNGGDFLLLNLNRSKYSEKIGLVSPGINVGVAKALNMGLESSLGMGAEYVITFDQDSDVASGMLPALLSSAKYLEAKGVFYSSVSPRYYDINSKRYMPFYSANSWRMTKEGNCAGSDVVPILSTITSGTLYKTSIFNDVGSFENELFIDHVDHEWCFRARLKGYQSYCCWGQTLFHRIGGLSNSESLLFRRRLKVHNPTRNYFYFRNSVALMLRSYVPLGWKILIFIDLMKKIAAITFFWDQRSRRALMVARGVFHGLRRKLS